MGNIETIGTVEYSYTHADGRTERALGKEAVLAVCPAMRENPDANLLFEMMAVGQEAERAEVEPHEPQPAEMLVMETAGEQTDEQELTNEVAVETSKVAATETVVTDGTQIEQSRVSANEAPSMDTVIEQASDTPVETIGSVDTKGSESSKEISQTQEREGDSSDSLAVHPYRNIEPEMTNNHIAAVSEQAARIVEDMSDSPSPALPDPVDQVRVINANEVPAVETTDEVSIETSPVMDIADEQYATPRAEGTETNIEVVAVDGIGEAETVEPEAVELAKEVMPDSVITNLVDSNSDVAEVEQVDDVEVLDGSAGVFELPDLIGEIEVVTVEEEVEETGGVEQTVELNENPDSPISHESATQDVYSYEIEQVSSKVANELGFDEKQPGEIEPDLFTEQTIEYPNVQIPVEQQRLELARVLEPIPTEGDGEDRTIEVDEVSVDVEKLLTKIVRDIEILKRTTTRQEMDQVVTELKDDLVELLRERGDEDAERMAIKFLKAYQLEALDEAANHALRSARQHHTSPVVAAVQSIIIGRHAVRILFVMMQGDLFGHSPAFAGKTN
jgi:arsenate reductase-like glutaredoxin family protein